MWKGIAVLLSCCVFAFVATLARLSEAEDTTLDILSQGQFVSLML